MVSLMKKKMLIYMDKCQLKSTGGPIGYNYNLMVELDSYEDSNVEFLNGTRQEIESIKGKINSIKFSPLRKLLVVLKHTYKYWKLLYGKKHNADVDLRAYAAVHFHSTYDMFSVRDSLKNYTGKVVLTSHSPTLLSNETYDGTSKVEKVLFPWIFKRLNIMDEYAFNRADKIVFPCEEAIEPYIHCCNNFKEKYEDKFVYLPTGITKKIAKIDKKSIRDRYNIPEDAFLICYVGRHNQIKGYDLLKIIGEKQLTNRKTYLIVAGAQGPLYAPKNDKWIEVGWTNDPYSIINAADVFLLPNRETYFDLVLLEVLSIGTPIVASYTGGNKYFEKFETDSIQLYKSEEECSKEIDAIRNMKFEEREKLRKENIALYEKYFTCRLFVKRYLKIVEDILGESVDC